MTTLGIVTGIDRANRVVNVVTAEGTPITAYFLGTPPWPLSTCVFDDGPEYHCVGPLGYRRESFADDFNYYTAGTPLIGNTGWTLGGVGTASTPNNPSDGNGVLRMTHTAVSNPVFIRKTLQMVTLTATRVYHMAARVRIDNLTYSSIAVGLADTRVINNSAPAATDAAAFAWLSGAGGSYNTLYTAAGGSGTSTSAGEQVADSTWVWVDVMVAGGQWAAMWVDGSGPWFSTTNVPSTSQDSVTPFVRGHGDLGTTLADVDYVEFSVMDAEVCANPAGVVPLVDEQDVKPD